ncbi:MAG: hypothetical protein MJ238_05590 [Bacilli bacterium]|nr:hypothetical protein [Bacilli bacterium]
MKKEDVSVQEDEELELEESFFSKSKRAAMNGWNRLKFVFSAILLLATFTFSLIGLLFKVIKGGFTTSTIILAVATSMYLVVLLLYWILLKARLKGKDDWALKEAVYNTKYFIKIIKVAVPIILLFNLIGKPLYDYFVIFFSGFSIIFGLTSFAFATFKMVRRIKNRKIRKEKHIKRNNKK